MRYVVLPQAFRNMLPVLLTQTIVLFQDTSLVYVLSIPISSAPPARWRSATAGWSRCICSRRVVYFVDFLCRVLWRPAPAGAHRHAVR